jgi:hypothetical protein
MADALKRWQQVKSNQSSVNILLSTGTDEHGIKVSIIYFFILSLIHTVIFSLCFPLAYTVSFLSLFLPIHSPYFKYFHFCAFRLLTAFRFNKLLRRWAFPLRFIVSNWHQSFSLFLPALIFLILTLYVLLILGIIKLFMHCGFVPSSFLAIQYLIKSF